MPVPGAPRNVHRTWIAAARQQSDLADCAAAAIRAAEGADAPPLAADYFPGYEIQREIHRGAQGTVYRAVQKSTGRRVALKLLHDHAFGGLLDRARFEREMQVLAALQHPNIVAIHDGGNHNGRFFLVMDYVAGQPLDAYLASRSRSIRETLELFIAICEAVNAAHVRGVIHRDLKPANVRVDEGGRPFVLDFGLAKLDASCQLAAASGSSGAMRLAVGVSTDSQKHAPAESTVPAESGDRRMAATATGQFLGSLPWAAPEQAAGSPTQIDTRTDVYSLGVMLYQILTGRFPYPVAGPMRRTLDSILHAPPTPPRGLRPGLDDELETIMLKCLSKERERRYQTAGELSQDLRRYLADEPIEAKRDSGWYRARVFLRRNRLPVAASAAFMIVLLGAFGFSLAQWRAAVQDRDRAALAEKQQGQERARAESHSRKLQNVNRFVQDLLLSADPYALPAGDVPARALLDNASRDIEAGELRDQPEVEAAVRTTLGRAYTTLARYEIAGVHLEAALRIIEQLAVPDQKALGDVLRALAQLRLATQELDTAEVLARRALSVRQAAYGDAHEEVAAAWDTLGAVLYAAQRFAEAEEAMRTAVATWRAALGENDPQVAAAVARLAMHTHDAGESTELLKQAVQQFEQAGEERSLHYAEALSDLARIQHLRREYAAAESSYLRAIAVRSAIIGGPNLYVLNDLDNVTLLYMQSGNWPRALEMSGELLRAAQALYGEDSPRAAQALMHVAASCRHVNENVRGLAAARQALQIHVRSGNDRTIDGLHARLGVAALALKCGQLDLAETAARECLDAPEDVLSMQPWRKPLAQSLLGSTLTERGQYEAAEPFLLAGYEGLSQSRNAPPDSRESAGERLVQLYERWEAAQPGTGKARMAEEWRTRLAASSTSSSRE
ncbi:MAG: Serine/threonine-protein kinase PknD [Phycisphaerae bacterium]|nr:Serine/threonine-protein kinase PknD [Phycisphaerae bacterium]